MSKTKKIADMFTPFVFSLWGRPPPVAGSEHERHFEQCLTKYGIAPRYSNEQHLGVLVCYI